MKKKIKISALILLVALLFSNCNSSNEVKSPEQKLIDRLNQRFDNHNYESIRSLNNPYNLIGIKVEEFRKEFGSKQKNVRTQTLNRSKLMVSGIFQFSSQNTETWGIESETDLQLAKDKINAFQVKSGYEYRDDKIDAINNKLRGYSRDKSGVNSLIEDALAKKEMSEIQSQILKSTISEISKASDVREANSINNTIEFEVINSGISERDKTLILSVNSILANNFKEQLSHLPNNDSQHTIFKKTIQVVLLVVAAAAVGAVAGGVVGWISCCLGSYNSCNGDCVVGYIVSGALVGATLGLVAIE